MNSVYQEIKDNYLSLKKFNNVRDKLLNLKQENNYPKHYNRDNYYRFIVRENLLLKFLKQLDLDNYNNMYISIVDLARRYTLTKEGFDYVLSLLDIDDEDRNRLRVKINDYFIGNDASVIDGHTLELPANREIKESLLNDRYKIIGSDETVPILKQIDNLYSTKHVLDLDPRLELYNIESLPIDIAKSILNDPEYPSELLQLDNIIVPYYKYNEFHNDNIKVMNKIKSIFENEKVFMICRIGDSIDHNNVWLEYNYAKKGNDSVIRNREYIYFCVLDI